MFRVRWSCHHVIIKAKNKIHSESEEWGDLTAEHSRGNFPSLNFDTSLGEVWGTQSFSGVRPSLSSSLDSGSTMTPGSFPQARSLQKILHTKACFPSYPTDALTPGLAEPRSQLCSLEASQLVALAVIYISRNISVKSCWWFIVDIMLLSA